MKTNKPLMNLYRKTLRLERYWMGKEINFNKLFEIINFTQL